MKYPSLTLQRTILVSSSLFVLLLVVSLFSMSIGTVEISLKEVINSIFSRSMTEENKMILFSIRLPRILLAIIVGGGLSIAGVVYQALLRNPLAEPFILGVSSGGTLGAVIVISLGIGLSIISIPIAAFLGSLIVIFIVYSVSQRFGRLDPTILLLTGIMVGAFFNAIILFILTLQHREASGAFLWLMGNLSNAELNSLLVITPLIIVTSVILYLYSREFNLIATGEETAAYLGVEVERLKRLAYIGASLITGLAVSVSGIIGFVGLIIPHISRILFGSDHRILIPTSFLIGAMFLVVVDTIARTIISPAEIPVGAVTAVIGAPIFIWFLKKRMGK